MTYRSWSGGAELRLNASSAGLLAVRVAGAVAHRRAGDDLTERDRRALSSVMTDLRGEASILRGAADPDLVNETAFAFADLALSALNGAQQKAEADADRAADSLDEIANELDLLANGSEIDPARLETVERLFMRASRLASDSLGRAGELSTAE